MSPTKQHSMGANGAQQAPVKAVISTTELRQRRKMRNHQQECLKRKKVSSAWNSTAAPSACMTATLLDDGPKAGFVLSVGETAPAKIQKYYHGESLSVPMSMLCNSISPSMKFALVSASGQLYGMFEVLEPYMEKDFCKVRYRPVKRYPPLEKNESVHGFDPEKGLEYLAVSEVEELTRLFAQKAEAVYGTVGQQEHLDPMRLPSLPADARLQQQQDVPPTSIPASTFYPTASQPVACRRVMHERSGASNIGLQTFTENVQPGMLAPPVDNALPEWGALEGYNYAENIDARRAPEVPHSMPAPVAYVPARPRMEAARVAPQFQPDDRVHMERSFQPVQEPSYVMHGLVEPDRPLDMDVVRARPPYLYDSDGNEGVQQQLRRQYKAPVDKRITRDNRVNRQQGHPVKKVGSPKRNRDNAVVDGRRQNNNRRNGSIIHDDIPEKKESVFSRVKVPILNRLEPCWKAEYPQPPPQKRQKSLGGLEHRIISLSKKADEVPEVVDPPVAEVNAEEGWDFDFKRRSAKTVNPGSEQGKNQRIKIKRPI